VHSLRAIGVWVQNASWKFGEEDDLARPVVGLRGLNLPENGNFTVRIETSRCSTLFGVAFQISKDMQCLVCIYNCKRSQRTVRVFAGRLCSREGSTYRLVHQAGLAQEHVRVDTRPEGHTLGDGTWC
jgi:hypothetical protein